MKNDKKGFLIPIPKNKKLTEEGRNPSSVTEMVVIKIGGNTAKEKFYNV